LNSNVTGDCAHDGVYKIVMQTEDNVECASKNSLEEKENYRKDLWRPWTLRTIIFANSGRLQTTVLEGTVDTDYILSHNKSEHF
jgi:hypothetical protein